MHQFPASVGRLHFPAGYFQYPERAGDFQSPVHAHLFVRLIIVIM